MRGPAAGFTGNGKNQNQVFDPLVETNHLPEQRHKLKTMALERRDTSMRNSL
jgi:hypothetical protein